MVSLRLPGGIRSRLNVYNERIKPLKMLTDEKGDETHESVEETRETNATDEDSATTLSSNQSEDNEALVEALPSWKDVDDMKQEFGHLIDENLIRGMECRDDDDDVNAGEDEASTTAAERVCSLWDPLESLRERFRMEKDKTSEPSQLATTEEVKTEPPQVVTAIEEVKKEMHDEEETAIPDSEEKIAFSCTLPSVWAPAGKRLVVRSSHNISSKANRETTWSWGFAVTVEKIETPPPVATIGSGPKGLPPSPESPRLGKLRESEPRLGTKAIEYQKKEGPVETAATPESQAVENGLTEEKSPVRSVPVNITEFFPIENVPTSIQVEDVDPDDVSTILPSRIQSYASNFNATSFYEI